MKKYYEIKKYIIYEAERYGRILNTFVHKHKLLTIFLSLCFVAIVLSISFYLGLPDVSRLKEKNPRITALMQHRIDESAKQGKKLKIYQRWVSFKKIPKKLRQAVRVSEDASFYRHNGIDFDELKESFKKNWKKGEIVRGGSTITQQLAKNLYLSTNRSYFRKIKEYFIARRLESALSKSRIFHLYLNIIELGPGIFGVQAASRYYFGKNVSRLTLAEMVRLAAIIPRPLTITPNSSGRWLKWKSKWILRKLKLYHYINNEEYETALSRL